MNALLKASSPSAPILAKCHQSLSEQFSVCIGNGAKVVYAYRHLFDVVLPSRDHAARARQTAMPQFREFVEDDFVIQSVKQYCQVAFEWKNFQDVCLVR